MNRLAKRYPGGPFAGGRWMLAASGWWYDFEYRVSVPRHAVVFELVFELLGAGECVRRSQDFVRRARL